MSLCRAKSDIPSLKGLPYFSMPQITMTDDRALTDRLFTALAVGANATSPLMTQNWGDYYGKLIDKFGVHIDV
jgi:uncharacterized glyoxalase superfamily protein PhnB